MRISVGLLVSLAVCLYAVTREHWIDSHEIWY